MKNMASAVLNQGSGAAVLSQGSGAGVEHWNDITSMAEISVSSRPSMLASLTDGSTGSNYFTV